MPRIYSNLQIRQMPVWRKRYALSLWSVVLGLALIGFGDLLGPSLAERAWPTTHLVMLEEDGCTYCIEWEKVIGPIYPKTTEGRIAPLRKVDIHGSWPDDLAAVRRDVYTPTFILVHDGEEVGRIRGYPGEDFFWGLLEQMVRKLPDDVRASGTVSTKETSG
jgi:hypothetical protein